LTKKRFELLIKKEDAIMTRHHKRRSYPFRGFIRLIVTLLAIIFTLVAIVAFVSPLTFLTLIDLLPIAVSERVIGDMILGGSRGLSYGAVAVVLWVVRYFI
jgi:hypothetical protein